MACRRTVIAWLKQQRIRIEKERAQRRYIAKHKNQINSVIQKSRLAGLMFLLASVDYCHRLHHAKEQWEDLRAHLEFEGAAATRALAIPRADTSDMSLVRSSGESVLIHDPTRFARDGSSFDHVACSSGKDRIYRCTTTRALRAGGPTCS